MKYLVYNALSCLNKDIDIYVFKKVLTLKNQERDRDTSYRVQYNLPLASADPKKVASYKLQVGIDNILKTVSNLFDNLY
jgi:hypothetical protein